MNNLTNYHTHSLFCDGRADMNDFIRFALSRGYSAIGFTSHAPLPFQTAWTMEWDNMDVYLSQFARLKERYRGRIELYLGLEVDYLDALHNPSLSSFATLPFDYLIGSVHLLHDSCGEVVDIDCPPERFAQIVDNAFGGDLDEVIRNYYGTLYQMLRTGGFRLIGHPDKMHYNACCYRPGLLDEAWYDRMVKEYFNYIVESGYLLEVNTKSYASCHTFFPNQRYFPYLKRLGARVVVNSDAHYPDLIDAGRSDALRALWAAGFRTVCELHGSEWVDVPIDQGYSFPSKA